MTWRCEPGTKPGCAGSSRTDSGALAYCLGCPRLAAELGAFARVVPMRPTVVPGSERKNPENCITWTLEPKDCPWCASVDEHASNVRQSEDVGLGALVRRAATPSPFVAVRARQGDACMWCSRCKHPTVPLLPACARCSECGEEYVVPRVPILGEWPE